MQVLFIIRLTMSCRIQNTIGRSLQLQRLTRRNDLAAGRSKLTARRSEWNKFPALRNSLAAQPMHIRILHILVEFNELATSQIVPNAATACVLFF